MRLSAPFLAVAICLLVLPGPSRGVGRADAAFAEVFGFGPTPGPSGSVNPAVPPNTTFIHVIKQAFVTGLLTPAQVDAVCALNLGVYSYYWAVVGNPQQRAYVLDFVEAFCISHLDQFVTIGNPSDVGMGDFEPDAFALFVVDMHLRGCKVNVFFDETILPPLPSPNVSSCQFPCGGGPNGTNCQCNPSSNPSNCAWQRCNPYPTTPSSAPPCCCASLDIKMNWVVAVQRSLRTLDPSFTLAGINIDIENVGECNKGLMLLYMKEYLAAAGEGAITVGDTVGYEPGQYIVEHFGVPNTANTTAVPSGSVTTPPLAVLYMQNYNQPNNNPAYRDFTWYSASYVAGIPASAVNATLQIMFTLNCCNGPCANPASASGTAEGCSDCGVCCSADTTCQSPYQLPPNDAWGDPNTSGPMCPYIPLRNGSAVTTDTMIQTVAEAQAAVAADPSYPTFAARGVSVTFTAYTLRSLHILLFRMDLMCANQNFCKPTEFPNGYGGFYNACGPKNCCDVTDDLCKCATGAAGVGAGEATQEPSLSQLLGRDGAGPVQQKLKLQQKQQQQRTIAQQEEAGSAV